MKPHKHAELIKAWADGAIIEKNNGLGHWIETNHPDWMDWEIYRIKPEIKLNWYRHYMVSEDGNGIYPRGTCEQMNANLRLWFDGKTGKLKDAEIVK
jgi:hypothetical protein